MPVRVFTKICMAVPTFPTSETNPDDQYITSKPKWCTSEQKGNYLVAFFLDFAFMFLFAIGLAGTGCPDLEAFKAALPLKFLALVSSAFFLTTAAEGFKVMQELSEESFGRS